MRPAPPVQGLREMSASATSPFARALTTEEQEIVPELAAWLFERGFLLKEKKYPPMPNPKILAYHEQPTHPGNPERSAEILVSGLDPIEKRMLEVILSQAIPWFAIINVLWTTKCFPSDTDNTFVQLLADATMEQAHAILTMTPLRVKPSFARRVPVANLKKVSALIPPFTAYRSTRELEEYVRGSGLVDHSIFFIDLFATQRKTEPAITSERYMQFVTALQPRSKMHPDVAKWLGEPEAPPAGFVQTTFSGEEGKTQFPAARTHTLTPAALPWQGSIDFSEVHKEVPSTSTLVYPQQCASPTVGIDRKEVPIHIVHHAASIAVLDSKQNTLAGLALVAKQFPFKSKRPMNRAILEPKSREVNEVTLPDDNKMHPDQARVLIMSCPSKVFGVADIEDLFAKADGLQEVQIDSWKCNRCGTGTHACQLHPSLTVKPNVEQVPKKWIFTITSRTGMSPYSAFQEGLRMFRAVHTFIRSQ